MKNRSKKGSALATVLMVMAVIGILGITIMSVSAVDAQHATLEERKTQAHYIGRSGVLFAIKILDEKVDEMDEAARISNVRTNVDDLVNTLNSYTRSIDSNATFSVGDEGNFKLNFEKYNNNQIKIVSEGITNGNSKVKDTVTYIVRVKPTAYGLLNPGKWLSDINLKHSVKEADDFLGYAVEFKLNPLHSPQNPGSTPVFQASVIYFDKGLSLKGDGTLVSLQQGEQSAAITFDAEILYFESDIETNTKHSPIKLRVSDHVLDYRANNGGVLDAYPEAVGFEDYNRYKNFIQGYSKDLHSKYTFLANTHYGLVRFKGNVHDSKGKVNTKIEPDHCYFFPDFSAENETINLQDENTLKKLIKILDDDAIIKAVDSYYNANRSGYIWNYK